MNDPCINKQCGAYENDEDYNCGHIIMDDPTKCKSYLMEKSEPLANIQCSDGLYGTVQWINDKPILDGMPYFETRELCAAYASRMGGRRTPPGIEVKYTIIRLEKDT